MAVKLFFFCLLGVAVWMSTAEEVGVTPSLGGGKHDALAYQNLKAEEEKQRPLLGGNGEDLINPYLPEKEEKQLQPGSGDHDALAYEYLKDKESGKTPVKTRILDQGSEDYRSQEYLKEKEKSKLTEATRMNRNNNYYSQMVAGGGQNYYPNPAQNSFASLPSGNNYLDTGVYGQMKNPGGQSGCYCSPQQPQYMVLPPSDGSYGFNQVGKPALGKAHRSLDV